MHVLQLSLDSSLVSAKADREGFERQKAYMRRLAATRPNARVSIVVTGADSSCRIEEESLVVTGVAGRGLFRLCRIWTAMAALHCEQKITVLTVQSVFDESGWLVLFFGIIHAIPCIGQIHTDCFSRQFEAHMAVDWKGRVRQMIWPHLISCFAALRVVGMGVQAGLKKKRVSTDRVRCIPVAMNIVGVSGRTSFGQRNREVLFVGRLVEEKDLPKWLQIAVIISRRVSDVRFTLIGDGPLRATLEVQANMLGLGGRITFAGYVKNAELFSYYSNASVFLLTSRYEGFGRVIAEALAYGLPCVATRVTGVEDIIEHGKSGYMHAAGDIAGMADSVCRILTNAELAEKLGRQGMRTVKQRYDPERLTREWVQMWCDIARGNGSVL